MKKIFTIPLYFSFFVVLLSLPLSAQLLSGKKSTVWISPEKVFEEKTPNVLIANYSLLDLGLEENQEELARIASHKTGTLFLVLKANMPELPDAPILKLGPAVVFPQRAVLDGKEIVLDTIDQRASILRLSYQGRPERRVKPGKVMVSDDISIAEVIFYDQLLSAAEMRIVESHLAMKYSINITANEDPELRDYVDVLEKKVWNVKTDQLYDSEVLALGRMDCIHFFQSQTFTSDTRTLKLSLDPLALAGLMPEMAISDSSLLIFSQRVLPPATEGCEGPPMLYPWKINLVNWRSSASSLFFTLDTVLGESYLPVLTDGLRSVRLSVKVIEGHTQIEIPLDVMDTEGSLYLAWESVDQQCEGLATMSLFPCDVSQSGFNGISVELAKSSLPASFSLVHLGTGESASFELSEAYNRIDNLPEGKYHLSVLNRERLLIDEMLIFGGCTDLFGMDDSIPWVLSSADNKVDWQNNSVAGANGNGILSDGSDQGISDPSIIVYPNPGSRTDVVRFAFSKLNGQAFTVQIYDAKGNFLRQEVFTPTTDQPVFKHHFRVEGSYFVRFFSDTYAETKHLRIKSNL